jgi:hypothetical protein
MLSRSPYPERSSSYPEGKLKPERSDRNHRNLGKWSTLNHRHEGALSRLLADFCHRARKRLTVFLDCPAPAGAKGLRVLGFVQGFCRFCMEERLDRRYDKIRRI